MTGSKTQSPMPTMPEPATLNYARPGDDESNLKVLELLFKTRRRLARVAVTLGWVTTVIGAVAFLFVPGLAGREDWPVVAMLAAWVASGVALMLIRENWRALANESMMIVIAIVAVLNSLPYAFAAASMLLLAAVEQRLEPLAIVAVVSPFLVAGALIFVLAMQCNRLMRLHRFGTVGQ